MVSPAMANVASMALPFDKDSLINGFTRFVRFQFFGEPVFVFEYPSEMAN
jgi:hypothetical protein